MCGYEAGRCHQIVKKNIVDEHRRGGGLNQEMLLLLRCTLTTGRSMALCGCMVRPYEYIIQSAIPFKMYLFSILFTYKE